MRKLISLLVCIFTWEFCYPETPPTDSVQQNKSSRKWYYPLYVPLQFAGNIGVLSLGLGYQAHRNKYQLSLVYGFAPASVAGVNIHMVTARNIFHIYKFPLNKTQSIIPYGALGLSFELGGRSFFRQPSYMPPEYYNFPKSVHLIPAIGLKLRHPTNKINGFHGVEFFAEASSVDAYIWYKFLSDDIKMHQILSLSFGAHFLLK